MQSKPSLSIRYSDSRHLQATTLHIAAHCGTERQSYDIKILGCTASIALCGLTRLCRPDKRLRNAIVYFWDSHYNWVSSRLVLSGNLLYKSVTQPKSCLGKMPTSLPLLLWKLLVEVNMTLISSPSSVISSGNAEKPLCIGNFLPPICVPTPKSMK